MLLIAARKKEYPILSPFVNGRKEKICRLMEYFLCPILGFHISLLHLPVIVPVAITAVLDGLE